jgi:hypothetical protein
MFLFDRKEKRFLSVAVEPPGELVGAQFALEKFCTPRRTFELHLGCNLYSLKVLESFAVGSLLIYPFLSRNN